MSPRSYRIALSLPAAAFLAGALLFAVPIALDSRYLPAFPGIALGVASWAALVFLSFAARCPNCRKSPYERPVPRALRLPFFPRQWGAPWPERRCSRCGLEVGAGRGRGKSG